MKQNPIIPPPPPHSHLAQAWKKISRGILFLSVGIVAIQHFHVAICLYVYSTTFQMNHDLKTSLMSIKMRV